MITIAIEATGGTENSGATAGVRSMLRAVQMETNTQQTCATEIRNIANEPASVQMS